jgi:hypothetical protein
MPQAIPAIISGAQAAYGFVNGAFVAAGNFAAGQTIAALNAVGVQLTASQFAAVTTAAYNVGFYGAQLGLATALTFATRPNLPDPTFNQENKKQPIPERVSGYGRDRLGGYYMLYEAKDKYAYIVIAMHDGLIDGWEDLYLHDRIETIGSGPNYYVNQGDDGRYGDSDLLQVFSRLGYPTETNYSLITAAIPDQWPSNARGDGIASHGMIAKYAKLENFLPDYPSGLPEISRVGRLKLCYDARLGARGTITDDDDKAASSTWAWTENPVWQLLDYMTNPVQGMGLDYTTRFLPRIDEWIAAADVCDESVPLKAGGTVDRYKSGGSYLLSTMPADVISTILTTFDGYLVQNSEGVFGLHAGEYVEPTVTIVDDHIISIVRQFWIEDEQAINQLVVSYKDPNNDYQEVETDPRRNEADIDARGVVRDQRLSMPWVQNNSQAGRLGKIALARANAEVRGTIVVDLDGLRAFGERRIRIQAPSDSVTMSDIVVDILPPVLNTTDFTVTIPFVQATPESYDWDAEEEEGSGPGSETRTPGSPPEPPDVPTDVAAVGGLGMISVSWVNPTSENFSLARVYVAATTDPFSGAANYGGARYNEPGTDDSYVIMGITTGIYDVWVVAENSLGQQSTPVGPVTVTVT